MFQINGNTAIEKQRQLKCCRVYVKLCSKGAGGICWKCKRCNNGPATGPTAHVEQTNCWALIDTPLFQQTAGSEDVESL